MKEGIVGRGDGLVMDGDALGELDVNDGDENFDDDVGIWDDDDESNVDVEENEEKESGEDGRWYMGFEFKKEGGELRGLTVAAKLAPKSYRLPKFFLTVRNGMADEPDNVLMDFPATGILRGEDEKSGEFSLESSSPKSDRSKIP